MNVASFGAIGGLANIETVTASPAANQNDYAPATISPLASVWTTLSLTPTVSLKLTGLSTTNWQTGKTVTIKNATDPAGAGARLIIIERASASSSAANRFNHAKSQIPVMLMPGDTVTVQWNGTNFDIISSSRPFTLKGYFDIGYHIGMAGDNFATTSGSAGISNSSNQAYTELTSGVPLTNRDIGTGTTNVGDTRQILSNDAGFQGGDGSLLHFSILGLPTLSTAIEEFIVNAGFIKGAITYSDGAGWRYDRTTSVNWQTVTRNNSVETLVAQSFAVTALRFMRLGTFINGNATRADFFYSDDEGVTWNFTAAITTNIPSGSARKFGSGAAISKTVGTTSRLLSMNILAHRRQALV